MMRIVFRSAALAVAVPYLLVSTVVAQSRPMAPACCHAIWEKPETICPGRPNTCRLILQTGATRLTVSSYEWEIWRYGSIERQQNTQSPVWEAGCFETSDTLFVRVRAVNMAGKSDWLARALPPPAHGCCR